MFSILVAGMFLVPVSLPQDKEKELPAAAKKELKALEGKWEFVKGVTSKEDGAVNVAEAFLEFKGKQMSMLKGDKKETIEITAIDSTTDPKCIDFLEKRKGKPDRTVEGIFKIDKDTLQLAIRVPSETALRPSSFEKPTDDRIVVWTLKRVKK